MVPSFGDDGVVDLSRDLIWPIDRSHFEFNAAPVMYKDLVIVGSAVGDRVIYRRAPPGDLRAYDARTGALVWSFHTIPQEGEFGSQTWENEAWRHMGATNRLGGGDRGRGARARVPCPSAHPTNVYYGGQRLGDNLFAESLVALDADTGERAWHFQIVHHGVWDYDLPTQPMLTPITVGGRRIEASHPALQAGGWSSSSTASPASPSGPSKNGRCRRATCPASGRRPPSRSRPGRQPCFPPSA